MVLKKVCFPFFYFTVLFFILISCESSNKKDKTYLKNLSKAENYFEKAAFDSSFYHFEKLKTYCISKNDFENIIYPILMMSEIQRIKNDFSGCEATVTEALNYVNKDTKISYLIFIYNNLALSYSEQNDYIEALKYYNLSLKISSDEISKCIIKNNIAYNYIKQKEYIKAKLVLESIKDNDSLHSTPIDYARVIDNLGYSMYKLNDAKAIEYLNQSLLIREKSDDSIGMASSFIHLSEYYQQSNSSLARDFALKAYNTAISINSPDDKIEALKFLINSSDPKEIRTLSLRQMAIYDSINKVRQNSKTQFSKIKYDFSIAKKDSEKQKTQKQLYLSLLLFITTLSLVSYFAFRSRNRRKLLEATYKTETRISKKLHDELANDVHNTIAFAETQNLEDPIHKETLLENLDTIYTRTRNISSENKNIHIGESFLDNLKVMITSYNSLERNIIINCDTLNWSKINNETKIVIYRIIQELLVNMKKHSQCSVASVMIKTDKKTIKINYSDNGVGSENKLKIKNGLQNVENRIDSIKGTVTFETEIGKGFKAKIIIPI